MASGGKTSGGTNSSTQSSSSQTGASIWRSELDAYQGLVNRDFELVTDKIEDLTLGVENSEKRFSKILKKTKADFNASKLEIEKKIVAEIEKVEKKQLNLVQTLSIFVAFFTFVSVEFGILTSNDNPIYVTAYTLILLGSLTFFSVLIDVVLNNKKYHDVTTGLFVLLLASALLITAGVVIIFKHASSNTQNSSDERSLLENNIIHLNVPQSLNQSSSTKSI